MKKKLRKQLEKILPKGYTLNGDVYIGQDAIIIDITKKGGNNSWYIDLADNYKLTRQKCKENVSFETKDAAIKFVLELTKKKFGGKILGNSNSRIERKCDAIFYDNEFDEICERTYWLWGSNEGFNQNIKII